MTARRPALPMGATRPSSEKRARRARHPNAIPLKEERHEHEWKDSANVLLEDPTQCARLQAETEVANVSVVGGDFLDVAQGELQELARLPASRLAQRARRLQTALSRASDGQYGVCSECGAAIPRKRLLAVPDATTRVVCQERLEHIGVAAERSALSGVVPSARV